MTGFEAPRLSGHRPAIGAVIERVDCHGKHIEIGWDDGIVLHTHMRMTGSWHLYRPGERWRKGTRSMRAVIEVEGFEAVCFNAPVVETFQAKDFVPHPGRRAASGRTCATPTSTWPSAWSASPSSATSRRRRPRCCWTSASRAGVGNVYKSEVLWACGVHPFTPVAALDLETRRALMETAASFLRANLDQPTRTTLPGSAEGVAVYGRYGKPCYRCGLPIEVRRHGEQSRVTYWCPLCQERREPSSRRGRGPTPRRRSTSRRPATGAVRPPSCSTTAARSAARSTRPTSCPRSSAIRPRKPARWLPASWPGAYLRRSAARPRARGGQAARRRGRRRRRRGLLEP